MIIDTENKIQIDYSNKSVVVLCTCIPFISRNKYITGVCSFFILGFIKSVICQRAMTLKNIEHREHISVFPNEKPFHQNHAQYRVIYRHRLHFDDSCDSLAGDILMKG